MRICKQIKKTKDGKREYPRYLAIFSKDDGKDIGYLDVKFAKDTIKAFDELRGESTYIDIELKVEERGEQGVGDAFIAPIKRKDEKGKYVNVLDKDGKIIPHLVIESLARANVLAEPLRLPERKRKDDLSPSNIFGGAKKENIDPNDSSLPF